VAGTLALSANLSRVAPVIEAAAGNLSMAGAVLFALSAGRTLEAAIAPQGDVTYRRKYFKVVAGAVAASGTVASYTESPSEAGDVEWLDTDNSEFQDTPDVEFVPKAVTGNQYHDGILTLSGTVNSRYHARRTVGGAL
jgi:hypothetical protein